MSRRAYEKLRQHQSRDDIEKHVVMVLVHHDEVFENETDVAIIVAHFAGVLRGLCEYIDNAIAAVAPARPGRDERDRLLQLEEIELYAEVAHTAIDLVVAEHRGE